MIDAYMGHSTSMNIISLELIRNSQYDHMERYTTNTIRGLYRRYACGYIICIIQSYMVTYIHYVGRLSTEMWCSGFVYLIIWLYVNNSADKYYVLL